MDLGDRILGLNESSWYDPAEQAQLADWIKPSQVALDVLEVFRRLDQTIGRRIKMGKLMYKGGLAKASDEIPQPISVVQGSNLSSGRSPVHDDYDLVPVIGNPFRRPASKPSSMPPKQEYKPEDK